MKNRMALVPIVLMTFLLAACGGDDESDEADEPGERSTTAYGETYLYCADLWVEGATIPDGYGGCYDEEEDTIVLPSYYDCEDGSRLASSDWGYGIVGGIAHPTPDGLDEPDTDSEEWKRLYEACMVG